MDKNAWKQTYTGKQFWFYHPHPSNVNILDIAHSLSNTCRYGGSCIEFYSVAQHSVLVSDYLPRNLALEGLLHDAAEAYIGDMISPLKRLLPDYKSIEALIHSAIAERFGIPPAITPKVKEIDVRMVATERLTMMSPEPAPWPGFDGVEPIPGLKIHPHVPQFARAQFLTLFKDLYHGE